MSATPSAAAARVDNFLGGKRVASDASPVAEVCNPATGDVLALTPAGGPADVAALVQAGARGVSSLVSHACNTAGENPVSLPKRSRRTC